MLACPTENLNAEALSKRRAQCGMSVCCRMPGRMGLADVERMHGVVAFCGFSILGQRPQASIKSPEQRAKSRLPRGATSAERLAITKIATLDRIHFSIMRCAHDASFAILP